MGPSWGHLGSSWGHLGASLGLLGRSSGHLVASWGHLGANVPGIKSIKKQWFSTIFARRCSRTNTFPMVVCKLSQKRALEEKPSEAFFELSQNATLPTRNVDFCFEEEATMGPRWAKLRQVEPKLGSWKQLGNILEATWARRWHLGAILEPTSRK